MGIASCSTGMIVAELVAMREYYWWQLPAHRCVYLFEKRVFFIRFQFLSKYEELFLFLVFFKIFKYKER